jgi:hypothetical protein
MFADVSHIIAHNPAALHGGVAVADLDGDGLFEFVVAGFGGPNRVLRWANGKLRDAASPDIADITRQAIGLAAGDIDGDGREELYILNVDTLSEARHIADRLFDVQPDGRWEDLFSRPANRQLCNATSGRCVAVIDRRGVGRYGFFVANHGQPLRLYEFGLDSALADLAPSLGLAFATGANNCGTLVLPIFSDRPDIICVNEHGPNFVFRNRGDGTFAECAEALALADPQEHARGIVAFDAISEAGFGLCWGNTEGPHRVMIPQENGPWRNRATPGLAFPSPVRTIIAADFDNDGHDELFFNNFGEANRVFRIAAISRGQKTEDRGQKSENKEQKGTDFASDLSSVLCSLSSDLCPLTSEITMQDPGEALDADGFATGAAVCDIDGDGVLELLVARGEREPQPLGVFKARGAAENGWLRVRPLTRFGAPARGAVVRAEAAGRVRVKGICGGSGYLCQMEPVAHFGFGRGGRAERVQVTWPDGAAVVLMNPGENRVVTVPYPRG